MKTAHNLSLALLLAISAPALAQQQSSPAPGAAAAGSAGTAATQGMSATTAGVGATSGEAGALATGAAAAGGERNRTRAAVHGNNNLNSQAMARAQDGGTFARSRTTCHERTGDSVECTTRTMTHEPGSKPEKSTVTGSATIPR
jgi:hypothetical protein